MLTYINTFLTNNASEAYNRYPVALKQGALIRDKQGDPVDILSGPSFPAAGLLDLSGPAGRNYATNMVEEMLAIGTSGWMADFGEYVPMDSQPASGLGPLVEHNRYPYRWQSVNQQAVAASVLYDKPVWFARSSGLTSPGVTPLFWLGDQLHSWDKLDGLASVVVAMLSSGMSGHTLTHSDVGGYTTVLLPQFTIKYTRGLELLQRWSELAIFTAFWRSHEGSAPTYNHQPYDKDALPHLVRCSALFASLAPYRRKLMAEAQLSGWPLVRATWLHYPDDPATLDLDAQFLEGGDLLVAPVLNPEKEYVDLYVPKDTWLHPFENRTYHSVGQTMTLPAPIGQPAVLVRLDPSTGAPPPELAPFLAAVHAMGDFPGLV